nr:reverse transcriptase domain-containing protein [Tanacetum cinerariifolium]
MGRDTIQLENAISTISQEYLLEFTSKYGIPESLHPQFPGPADLIVEFPKDKVGVYTKFFEFANFHIPISQFLFDILDMDLCSLISAPNPAKVKTGTRPRAAQEVTDMSKMDKIKGETDKTKHGNGKRAKNQSRRLTMAYNRTMEEMLQAPTKGDGYAIVVSDILVENFKIKTELLSLIQANQFHGFESNNPHYHIRSFNRITSTLKFRNVPNDTIKLMLFPYSLEEDAKIWYEKEPPRSILTWGDLVSKFVIYFVPSRRPHILRMKSLDLLKSSRRRLEKHGKDSRKCLDNVPTMDFQSCTR